MNLRIKLNLDVLISAIFTESFYFEFTDITNIEEWAGENGVQKLEFNNNYPSNNKTMYVFIDQQINPDYDEQNANILNLCDTTYLIFTCNISNSSITRLMDWINKGIIEVNQSGNTTIFVYKQNSENDVINKTLTFVDAIDGKFNHMIGLKQINIDIKDYARDYNYIFIPSLNRYYYVDSVELVSADISRLHLKEDVLMSWKTLISQQDAYVTRYENSTNTKLVDDRQPLENVLTIQYKTMTNLSGGKKNIDLTFDTNNIPNILIVTRYFLPAGTLYDTASKTESIDDGYLPELLPHNAPNLELYFMLSGNYGNLGEFIDACYSDDATASYLDSILVLPFDPSNAFNLTKANYDNLLIGDKQLKIDSGGTFVSNTESVTGSYMPKGYVSTTSGGSTSVRSYQSVYLCVFDGYYYETDSWEMHEPYANYELYVPFVGYVKLNSYDIINKRIYVYYVMEVRDGSATAFIYNRTDHKVIWSGTCQLAVKIDVTKSNTLETTKQRQSNDLNMILGLVSSALSIGVGVASENPVAIAGGVLSASKTIASNVNANRMLFNRAQTTYGSGDASFYSIQDVHMKITKNAKMTQLSSIYKKLQGLPYNTYTALSGLTGYIEIGDIHFDPKANDIYQDEITEIVELLKNGVII